MMDEVWRVYRDGKPVPDELQSENDCFVWLPRHQPNRTMYGRRYGGYGIRQEAN
jgi:hypothetical protein